MKAKLVVQKFFVECPQCGSRFDAEDLYSSRIERTMDNQTFHCPACCTIHPVDFYWNH